MKFVRQRYPSRDGRPDVDVIPEAALKALARLGHQKSLDQVLQAMSPSRSPKHPNYETYNAWWEYDRDLSRAIYVRQTELVPVLVGALDLRDGHSLEDVSVPSPCSVAVKALCCTVPPEHQPDPPNDPDQWKAWWKTKGQQWFERQRKMSNM